MNELIDYIIQSAQQVEITTAAQRISSTQILERRGDAILLPAEEGSRAVVIVNIATITSLGPVNLPPKASM